MIESEITIRSIQHYLYCPHRWGLLEIDNAWAENYYVTKANLMHERVHDNTKSYTSRGKTVFTSVSVFNEKPEYCLYGITDCIEVTLNGDGTIYKPCIVEYKPTKPKSSDYSYDDLMQVFAQKICVDYVFGVNCEAAIYYGDTKRRVRLPLYENFIELDQNLKKIISEIRYNIIGGIIPPIKKGQKCSGCSMKDICIPSLKVPKNIRNDILAVLEDPI